MDNCNECTDSGVCQTCADKYFLKDKICKGKQKVVLSLNLLRTKFSEETKNQHLHFMSFLHIDMTQVVEILPQIVQELPYST